MTLCNMTRAIVVTLVAAGLATGATAAPASKTQAPKTQASSTKPLPLKKFMRKPVANSAARTVKKKDGEYANVAVKHRAKRAKRKATAKPTPAPASVPPAAQVAPETMPPAAAQAFASYELARVRVVTPPDDNGQGPDRLNLMTDPTAAASQAPTEVSVEHVDVVHRDEVNALDRKADASPPVSLDALSRTLAVAATDPKSEENDSWFHKMLLMLGGAFAAAAALVRGVFG